MVKIHQKNIFLSSACTYPKDYSAIGGESRFFHLIGTIDSCKKVDDSINLIAEASSINEMQKKALEMKNAVLFDWSSDEKIRDASNNKQSGTLSLWLKTLETIEVSDDSNIFFLSGRYRLTSEFKLEDFEGDYVFKKHWYAEGRGGWFGTQLFKISSSKKDEFIEVIKLALEKLGKTAQDVECSIYQAIAEKNIVVKEIDHVGCEGILAPTGKNEKH
jgi:hypothetical protein